MARRTILVTIVAACALLGQSARGELIVGFGLLPAPDVTTGFMDVYYDASTDELAVDGSALTYDDGSGPMAILDGVLTIAAMVDDVGLASSGSLLIEGSIPSVPFMSPLLEGTLLDFGWVTGGGDLFQFVFAVSGGSLSTEYGGPGAEFGVLLDANIPGGYSGDWTEDFDNRVGGQPGTGTGVANIAPVPGASALPLLALAGLVCSTRSWRKEGRV
jgi:hypothetical protein